MKRAYRLVDPLEITGGSDPFGRKGNGFWFRGIANIVRNNVAADTREGINYSPGSAESGPNSTLNDIKVPNFPCADTSVAGQFKAQQLIRTYNKEFVGNEVYSTSQFGFGTWFTEMPTTGRVPFRNTTIWHFAGTAGLYHRYWNGSEDGLVILNEGGVGLAIAQDNFHRTGMATYSEIRNANIQGVETIFNKLGQLALGPEWLFQDGLFRSVSGFALNGGGQANTPSAFTFRNLRFQPLPGRPLKAFTLSMNGSDQNNYPKTFRVYAYQGNANDNFRVFYAAQAPDAPAPPPTISAYSGGGCPAGLTNQQCWDARKTATFQELAACSTTRQEFVAGLVCSIAASGAATTASLSQIAPSSSRAMTSAVSPRDSEAGTRAERLGLSPPSFVVLDDQLFDVADDGGKSPVEAGMRMLSSDANGGIWNLRYRGWQGGVLPVEFADDISQARRDLFMSACNAGWGGDTHARCIERTSQFGYVRVTQFEAEPGRPSCYSAVGQSRRLIQYPLNLASQCWTRSQIHHQIGHALGFVHEQQRPDRDSYVTIDTSNVEPAELNDFTRVTSLADRAGTYDFLSVMQSPANYLAREADLTTIVPRAGYASYSASLGLAATPSALDRDAMRNIVDSGYRVARVEMETPIQKFDRVDFLDALERLDAYYRSASGFNKPQGLAAGRKVDFEAIASWILDVYLGARSARPLPRERFCAGCCWGDANASVGRCPSDGRFAHRRLDTPHHQL